MERASKRSGNGSRGSRFFADDGGFTQLGVVVALLLSISLLSTSAQAYWIQSRSADIQYAADSSALAGTNVVGEYLIVARVADAVVLSMSLTGLTLYAASAIASCIPYVDTIAPTLSDAAARVLRARDSFADKAIASLDKLQRALPYLCAVNAATVSAANASENPSSAGYVSLTLPVPLEGEATDLSDDKDVEEAGDTIGKNDEEVSQSVSEADQAADDMNAAKLAGYEADCGASVCMRERAEHLAGLSGISNPDYSSVDLWGFDVAIARAQAYYRARVAEEAPEGDSTDAQVDSIARMRFYRYALEQVSKGYVNTDVDGVTTAYLVFLPENTEDVRGTALYTESIYPLSSEGGTTCLHATSSCPGCTSVTGSGALCDIDAGSVSECPICQFSIVDIGKAPAASTSIDNGFEHYYRAVARAAELYSEASKEYAEKTAEAKSTTSESMDAFSNALESFKARRYDPKPPGRYGCVTVVIDMGTYDTPVGLRSLGGGTASIGPRLAISAAMLAPEDPTEGSNVISSLLSGLIADHETGDLGFLADSVVGLWGDMLLAYMDGTEGLLFGVEEILDGIPGIEDSGLSRWARKSLEDIIELVGLEPVKMESCKPVLVNTEHVLSHSEGGIGDLLQSARTSYEVLEADYLVATITLPGGLPDFDVTLALPESIADAGASLIERMRERWLGMDPADASGVVRWE